MKHRLFTRASTALRTMSFVTLTTLGAVGAAQAGPKVQLQAAASSELPNDEMVVQLAVERAGPTAEKLNDEVLNALNLADKKYVVNCDAASQCFYGVGRIVKATLTKRW